MERKKNELLYFSSNDIREYFKFFMGVGTKPSTRSYAIFVDDTERTK